MQSTVQIPELGTSVENIHGYSYKILKAFSSPVSGSIYLATDVFEKSYALHAFTAPGFREEDAKMLWIKETYALRSLFHPSLAYVHDTFEYKSGFYLVTEVLGEPLSAYTQGLPAFNETQILAIARDLFFGLSFAHWHQLIHGDLSLDTVRFDLSGSYVKMTDFGVSAVFEPAEKPRLDLKSSSNMLPNLNRFCYSNEQADLYLTGIVLLSLKLGKPVFGHVASLEEVQNLCADGYPRKIAESLGTPFGDKVSNLFALHARYPYLSAVHAWSDFRELLKNPRFQ